MKKNSIAKKISILIPFFGTFIFQSKALNLKEFTLYTKILSPFEFPGFPRNQKTGCCMNARLLVN